MTSETLSIKPDSQVEFFLPIFTAYVEKLVQAFSKTKESDLSKAEWQLILADGHIGKFLNHHILIDAWEEISKFLKKEEKLFGFIEERRSGLVEIDYKFWIFFSANSAIDFFKNQIDRPKNFKTSAIITLPFIKLLEPFTEKLDRVLRDKDLSVIKQMGKTLEVLSLAEWYLDEADFTIFDAHIKKAVVNLALSETGSLIKEVRNPSSSLVLLEKRLNGLFKIGWRYFRTKNELETKYFKKLLSEDPAEQEKGLKLTYKKVSDFKKSFPEA